MAKYLEIANDIREQIAAGKYPVGSKIPGIPDLQSRYNVRGLNTVRAAHQVLIEEGLLRSEQGVGTFVVAVPERTPQVLDVLAELRTARGALDRAIRGLEG